MPPIRVLIVDDDIMLCRALATRLAWARYEVASAHSGMRAIETCAAQPPDAMILDVALPDMSGYRVCQQLRERLHNDTTAVVFLSGMTQPGIGAAGVDGFLDDIGGHFFLSKPYDARQLIALLDSVTGKPSLAVDDWLLPGNVN